MRDAICRHHFLAVHLIVARDLSVDCKSIRISERLGDFNHILIANELSLHTHKNVPSHPNDAEGCRDQLVSRVLFSVLCGSEFLRELLDGNPSDAWVHLFYVLEDYSIIERSEHLNIGIGCPFSQTD